MDRKRTNNDESGQEDHSTADKEVSKGPGAEGRGGAERPDSDEADERPDVDYETAPAISLGEAAPADRSHWAVNLVAGFTLLSGLVGTIQPLAARLAQHPKIFSIVVPYDYYHFSKSLHVVFGLLLTYLSLNLFKRKKNAWLAALVITLFSAVLHAARIGVERIKFISDRDLSEGIPLVTVAIPALAAVLLIVYRQQFTVLSEKHRMRTGLRVVALSVVLAVAYGTLGFWLLEPHDFGLNFQLSEAFTRALRELCFVGNTDITARSGSAKWFMDSLHVFRSMATAYAAFSMFRPIQYKLSIHPKEQDRALSILRQYGKDALDHYKTLPDKSYFFLPGGNSYIAYKTVLNVAIGLGDPVGPDDEIEKVTQAFRTFCRNNDWKMAFLQVKPDNIETYEKLGLDVLKVGEEAIIDLDKFATETIKGKNFKSKVKKFEKDGFILERLPAPHTKELVDTIQKVSDEWLSLPGRRERGFSLGWFEREAVEKETVFVLRDPQNQIIAFVNQVPSYAHGEASIDMMRHKETVPNGTMDYLFTKLLTALREDGYKTFNLGLAALSGVGDQADASLEERAIHQIYEHMNRFFSYKGLRQYKNKFSPTWKASYLVYEGGPPGLIKTALAITRAGELNLDDDD
jgi:phosphatidylglycerol lysyltransferase